MTRIRCSIGLSSLILLLLASPSWSLAQTRDPLPLPDVLGYRTLKCDFHLHTVFSDGEVWPTTRLAEAWRDGLDVIAITDHSDYNPHKDDLKADSARAYEIIRPQAENLGIVLIPAVEIAEGDIHFNALFVKDANAFKGAKLLEALQLARTQDAFTFWNHPGWKRPSEWFPPIAAAYDQNLFQGMELVNGQTFYPEAYPWVDAKKLTILADSDAHGSISATMAGNTRPITLVFSRTADTAGVREALVERRTAAWMGGEVWGPEPFLKGLWENAVKIENPQLSAFAAGPGTVLRLRNASAMPFKFRIRKTPSWMRVTGDGTPLRAQSILACSVRVTKDAPAGVQPAELELEVTNLHVGPGKNLAVIVPLNLSVRQ